MSIRVEVEHLRKLFAFEHLPPHLQAVSRPFAELAEQIAAGPLNLETPAALRKLREAKDCAVTAVVIGEVADPA